jgi:hypothetical protein
MVCVWPYVLSTAYWRWADGGEPSERKKAEA